MVTSHSLSEVRTQLQRVFSIIDELAEESRPVETRDEAPVILSDYPKVEIGESAQAYRVEMELARARADALRFCVSDGQLFLRDASSDAPAGDAQTIAPLPLASHVDENHVKIDVTDRTLVLIMPKRRYQRLG